MNTLLEQIKKKNAKAFTHSGKFHADDVFSYALLLYLNPAITITRGNKVPKDFDGIVFDIGRGKYDHHQRDSRIRENGVPYAAFGLLWEELGADILAQLRGSLAAVGDHGGGHLGQNFRTHIHRTGDKELLVHNDSSCNKIVVFSFLLL